MGKRTSRCSITITILVMAALSATATFQCDKVAVTTVTRRCGLYKYVWAPCLLFSSLSDAGGGATAGSHLTHGRGVRSTLHDDCSMSGERTSQPVFMTWGGAEGSSIHLTT